MLYPCKEPGCPELLNKPGRCKLHAGQYRKSFQWSEDTKYGSKWHRYRKHYLQEHPLCVICLKQGRVTAATVVDHIIPHRGDIKLFWDTENHQSLCDPCHGKKTWKETLRDKGGVNL